MTQEDFVRKHCFDTCTATGLDTINSSGITDKCVEIYEKNIITDIDELIGIASALAKECLNSINEKKLKV